MYRIHVVPLVDDLMHTHLATVPHKAPLKMPVIGDHPVVTEAPFLPNWNLPLLNAEVPVFLPQRVSLARQIRKKYGPLEVSSNPLVEPRMKVPPPSSGP